MCNDYLIRFFFANQISVVYLSDTGVSLLSRFPSSLKWDCLLLKTSKNNIKSPESIYSVSNVGGLIIYMLLGLCNYIAICIFHAKQL